MTKINFKLARTPFWEAGLDFLGEAVPNLLNQWFPEVSFVDGVAMDILAGKAWHTPIAFSEYSNILVYQEEFDLHCELFDPAVLTDPGDLSFQFRSRTIN